jgi:hypothetical protein
MNNLHKDYLVKDMSAFAIMLSTTSIITYLLAGVGYYLFMVRAQHHEASQARSNPTNGPRKIDAASMKKDYSSLAGMFPFFAVWRRKANKIISGKEKDTAATDRPSDTMNFTSSGTARRVRNNGEKATTRVDGSSPAPFSQDQEAVASGTQRALADNIV